MKNPEHSFLQGGLMNGRGVSTWYTVNIHTHVRHPAIPLIYLNARFPFTKKKLLKSQYKR